MELRAIWQILWRRKWIVSQVFLVVFTTILTGSFLMPPVYETSLNLITKSNDVESATMSAIGLQQRVTPLAAINDTEIDTHIELITSDLILEDVINKLQLRSKKGVLYKPSDLQKSPPLISNIFPKPNVKISQVEDTEIIEIKAKAEDNEAAAMIANTLAEFYIQENLKQRKQEYEKAREFIQSQLTTVKSDYIKTLEDIKQFKINHNTVDIDTETRLVVEKMASLLQDKEETIIKIMETRARIGTFKTQYRKETGQSVSSAAIKENPQIEFLKRNLTELEVDLAGLMARKAANVDGQSLGTLSSAVSYTPQIELLKKTISNLEIERTAVLMEKRPNHPEAMALDKQLITAKKDLQTEIEKYWLSLTRQVKKIRTELEREVANFKTTAKDLEEYQRELAALEIRLKGVDGDIKTHRLLLSQMPEKIYGQSQLQLSYSVSQQLYSSLLEYLYQVGLAEAMTLSDLKIVAPAPVPEMDKPKSPKKALNAIMGILLGSILGLGLAFFIDYYDDTIKTSEEAKASGVSILGMIPKLKGRRHLAIRNLAWLVFRRKKIPKLKIDSDYTLIKHLDPKNPISEAYRYIRNNLKFASLDSPLNSLVVMSALMNEGKTTTACNLAVSFCREGKRVLLIDVDLRRPSAHLMFNETNIVGLTNVLVNDIKLDQVIKKTSVENLFFLASGPMPPDPGRLIESDRMRNLIKELSRDYDMLILDSPPVLIANDAVILAGYVDGALSVMESQVLTHKALDRMTTILEQAQIRLLGTVMNKAKISNEPYYYYYYYYSYHQYGTKKGASKNRVPGMKGLSA